MEEKELKVLKLDEMTDLISNIFFSLFAIIVIVSFIEYGFSYYNLLWAGVISVLFLPPIICIISGILIMILSKLNYVTTDGNWGTLNLIVSVYSEIYPEYFNDEE